MVSGISRSTLSNEVQITERGTKIINGEESIGKDAFLKLLVAQMQHQDPFNSQDPTKYVEQMATFSNLEQMTNMNSNLELLLGVNNATLINSALSNTTSAIGKNVEVSVLSENGIDKEEYKGIVKSTFIQNGGVYIELETSDGVIKEFPYESIVKIGL